jgi:predicted RNase H-like nuclease (RuvC/YqgF family)
VVEKMFGLESLGEPVQIDVAQSDYQSLQKQLNTVMDGIKTTSREANEQYFTMEMDKLDHRADDLKISLEKQRKSIKSEILQLRKEYRAMQQLEEKVATQRKIRNLEQKESKLRREINELEDQIDAKKEVLIDEIQKRLEAQSHVQELFTIQWKIV